MMANKMGSNRIGWNQRGPTNRELMQQARDLSNYDSYHWENATLNLKAALCERMGDQEFEEWVEGVFPGETIDLYTWKQIHDTFLAKLERIQLEDLEAEAHDWMNRPEHYKTNGGY